jgi:hypothetical protein
MTPPVVHPIVRSLATDGPMLPTLVDGLPDRAGWVFEPKWDGWRCVAVVDHGRVDLRSRRAVDLAPYFPELTQTIHPLAGRRAALDGVGRYPRPRPRGRRVEGRAVDLGATAVAAVD